MRNNICKYFKHSFFQNLWLIFYLNKFYCPFISAKTPLKKRQYLHLWLTYSSPSVWYFLLHFLVYVHVPRSVLEVPVFLGTCTNHRVIYRLTLHVYVPTYLLTLHDFRPLFNSPCEFASNFVLPLKFQIWAPSVDWCPLTLHLPEVDVPPSKHRQRYRHRLI